MYTSGSTTYDTSGFGSILSMDNTTTYTYVYSNMICKFIIISVLFHRPSQTTLYFRTTACETVHNYTCTVYTYSTCNVLARYQSVLRRQQIDKENKGTRVVVLYCTVHVYTYHKVIIYEGICTVRVDFDLYTQGYTCTVRVDFDK